MRLRIHTTTFILFFVLLTGCGTTDLAAQETLTFEDVMQFEAINQPVLSENGNWVAFGVWPERGDGEVRVKHTSRDLRYSIERGEFPQISSDEKWVAAYQKPAFLELENAENDAPKRGLALLNTESGEKEIFENIRVAEFSNDGKWLLLTKERDEDVNSDNPLVGYPVHLVNLDNRNTLELPFVSEASIDSTSSYFVYAKTDTLGENNAIYGLDLHQTESEPTELLGKADAYYSNLTWDQKRARLAFTEAEIDTAKDYWLRDATLYTWQGFDSSPDVLISPEDVEDGYRLRSRNNITWTYDGDRLFYGVKSAEMVSLDEREARNDTLTAENMYDTEHILEEVRGKVWHWDDPQIKTHEKQTFDGRKNNLYAAVYHLNDDRNVQLATHDIPNVRVSHNTGKVIGLSDIPYQKTVTWGGRYSDFYLIDLESGLESQFLKRQGFGASLSPNGKFTAWFDGKDWNIMNTETGLKRNLTHTLDVQFSNEENDRPQPSGSYGIAGWTDDDVSIMIYDKYDIWEFSTENEHFHSITDETGRQENRIFRIRDLKSDRHTFSDDEHLLLTMFHDWDKNYGFYEANTGSEGVNQILEGEKRFNILAKAEESDQILFTTEKYDVYPNLWISNDRQFGSTGQLTFLYEDLKDRWNWGTAELIDWLDLDGKETQGIVFYPDDYDSEKTYPVFIYYYERFSQRLYDFNHPVTNHRPNVAQYVSDGYVVFMPDVWFTIPEPGYSATKSIVPGVHKLVEMGVADPDAIGLHGHSWSGYLTAHVVTQTDMFAAAVAGAPVSNMTSAYGGIRWGTGLARQFQYEKTQSRLGVSLWENPNPYIENSPLFFADRINTPIMIQHGDADEAVPWYQSIELYLALRRNGKESVFLHYYDEPHHLRQFANRLDYAMKMKEYMDHYLRGHEAPAWIDEGVPYLGE